jgi:predicted CoA-binding protein
MPIWNKYRPAILKLMVESANEPQQYKLSAHEFRAMTPKPKTTYTFALEAAHGKALNRISDIPVAVDLLLMLQQSNKAMELMKESTYALSMDRHFVLHVSRK